MSLALYNCRRRLYADCRRLSMTAFAKNNVRGLVKFKEYELRSVLPCRTWSIPRYLSTQTDPDSNGKPAYIPLMDFPPICWPRYFGMLKFMIMVKLVLPFVDKDFDVAEFFEGFQQAVVFVSDALSREDYDSLEGLVTPKAIVSLKTNISKLGDEQKRQIRIEKREMLVSFPNDINVRDGTDKSTKILEIMVVQHCLRDLKLPGTSAEELMRDNEVAFQRMSLITEKWAAPEYQDQAIVCNYRFIREIGSSDKSWSIDMLNQFRLCDVLE